MDSKSKKKLCWMQLSQTEQSGRAQSRYKVMPNLEITAFIIPQSDLNQSCCVCAKPKEIMQQIYDFA